MERHDHRSNDNTQRSDSQDSTAFLQAERKLFSDVPEICYTGRKIIDHFCCLFSLIQHRKFFAAKVIADYGRVDFLVNNAMPLFKGIDQCSYEEFEYAQRVGVAANPEDFDLKNRSVEEIIQVSCQAEVVHEVIMPFSFVPILFSI